MTYYPYLKLAHVFFAIVALGSNLTYPVWLQRAQRSPEYLPFTLRSIYFLDSYVANPAYVLGRLSGLTMVWLAGHDWQNLWISGALGLFAAVAMLGYGLYTPGLRRQITALDQHGYDSPEYRRIDRQQTGLGIVLGVLVILILVLMLLKPV